MEVVFPKITLYFTYTQLCKIAHCAHGLFCATCPFIITFSDPDKKFALFIIHYFWKCEFYFWWWNCIKSLLTIFIPIWAISSWEKCIFLHHRIIKTAVEVLVLLSFWCYIDPFWSLPVATMAAAEKMMLRRRFNNGIFLCALGLQCIKIAVEIAPVAHGVCAAVCFHVVHFQQSFIAYRARKSRCQAKPTLVRMYSAIAAENCSTPQDDAHISSIWSHRSHSSCAMLSQTSNWAWKPKESLQTCLLRTHIEFCIVLRHKAFLITFDEPSWEQDKWVLLIGHQVKRGVMVARGQRGCERSLAINVPGDTKSDLDFFLVMIMDNIMGVRFFGPQLKQRCFQRKQ